MRFVTDGRGNAQRTPDSRCLECHHARARDSRRDAESCRHTASDLHAAQSVGSEFRQRGHSHHRLTRREVIHQRFALVGAQSSAYNPMSHECGWDPQTVDPGETEESTGQLASSELAAIIVYFRTPACLNSCLHGLQTQTKRPDEILVIDNSSTIDGHDVPPVPEEGWRWVRAERNLGFGAACNLGAKLAHSDYLLFLNADVVLRSQGCERLCSFVEDEPGIGVVGPRIYDAEGRIELSARAFPSVKTGLLGRSSLLTQMLAQFRQTPSGVSAALGSASHVDWISGACMLMPREAFDQVGGFDESYWMYWEDADICRRLKDRGWSTGFCTDAQSHHSTGSSGRSRRTIEAFHMSASRYYERHVARSALTATLARSALTARMNIMLHRHARRATD